MIKIGVVGNGFVGKAVVYGFSNGKNEIFIADPKEGTSTKDLLNKDLDVIFICTPTPMGSDGTINSSIVEQVFQDLKQLEDVILVLKSTVTPDIVQRLAEEYPTFVYNPEFLTERNALEDFVNPISNVYGGKKINTKYLEYLYQENSICKPAQTFHMSAVEASFVKYGMNTFLASKVLFWNQFYDICQKQGADYSIVSKAIGNDPRIGSSHMSVPGHDGKRYFGGACFTKDTAAFIKFAKNEFTVLNEVVKVNNEGRKQYELCDREKEQNVNYNLS